MLPQQAQLLPTIPKALPSVVRGGSATQGGGCSHPCAGLTESPDVLAAARLQEWHHRLGRLQPSCSASAAPALRPPGESLAMGLPHACRRASRVQTRVGCGDVGMESRGRVGLKAVMSQGTSKGWGRTSSGGRLGKGWERQGLSRVWGSLGPLEGLSRGSGCTGMRAGGEVHEKGGWCCVWEGGDGEVLHSPAPSG